MCATCGCGQGDRRIEGMPGPHDYVHAGAHHHDDAHAHAHDHTAADPPADAPGARAAISTPIWCAAR